MNPQQALSRALELEEEGDRLAERGSVTGALYRYEQGLALLTAVARGRRTPRVLKALAGLANAAAIIYQQRGELAKALQRYEQALKAERSTARSPQIAVLLGNIGGLYEDLGSLDRALVCYQEALKIQEGSGARSVRTAELLTDVGRLQADRGDPSGALGCYRRALGILEMTIPRSETTAACLRLTGDAYRLLGDLERASDYAQRALEMQENIDPQSDATALALNDLGVVLAERRELDRALECFERALAIHEASPARSRSVEKRGQVASCLNNIGAVHSARGDLDKALEYYRRALQFGEAIAPDTGLSSYLGNIAAVYAEMGDLARAWGYAERALAVSEGRAPRSLNTAGLLCNMATIVGDLGHPERALTYDRRALEIQEAVAPHSEDYVRTLTNIGVLYADLGDLPQALQYLERAAEIRQGPGFSLTDAHLLRALGGVYSAAGNRDRALVYFQTSLEISELMSPGSLSAAKSLNRVAEAHRLLGDPGVAVECGERALRMTGAIAPNSEMMAQCLGELGLAYRNGWELYRERHELDRAIGHLQRAVEVVESLRTRAGEVRAREHLGGRHYALYCILISCLHDRDSPGDHALAFGYAERSRARTLVELLAERDIDFFPETGEQHEVLSQERRLKHRLANVHDEVAAARQAGGDLERLIRLEAEERELEEELDRLKREIRKVFPAYAEIAYPKPITLEEAQGAPPSGLVLVHAESADAPSVAPGAGAAEVDLQRGKHCGGRPPLDPAACELILRALRSAPSSSARAGPLVASPQAGSASMRGAWLPWSFLHFQGRKSP